MYSRCASTMDMVNSGYLLRFQREPERRIPDEFINAKNPIEYTAGVNKHLQKKWN
jgi:hypothetical protein